MSNVNYGREGVYPPHVVKADTVAVSQPYPPPPTGLPRVPPGMPGGVPGPTPRPRVDPGMPGGRPGPSTGGMPLPPPGDPGPEKARRRAAGKPPID